MSDNITTSNKVYIGRDFQCTPETLFKWLTQPDLIVQWFGPKALRSTRVVNEARNGGKFRIELIRVDSEDTVTLVGEYIEFKEPERVAFRYSYDKNPATPSFFVVRMSLSRKDDGTTKLSMVQEFEAIPDDIEQRTVAWEYMLEVLAGLIPSEK